jgi:integrase
MRAGEIRRLRWEHINEWSAFLPKTKNGTSRDVPLTEAAEQQIRDLRQALPRRLDGWVFGPPDLKAEEGGFTASMVVNHFRDAVALMKECAAQDGVRVPHLTFHDLRHVAITRLAPLHRDGLHLSKTTGHKTLSQLKRYFNPTGEEQAKEIRAAARERQARGLA